MLRVLCVCGLLFQMQPRAEAKGGANAAMIAAIALPVMAQICARAPVMRMTPQQLRQRSAPEQGVAVVCVITILSSKLLPLPALP